MGKKTVFLDRDGVINENRDNDYVKTWDEFRFLPKAKEAIKSLTDANWNIIIISNQAGVGKGIMSAQAVEEINARMIDATSGEIYCAVSHRRQRSQREREFAQLPDQQRKRVNQEYHKRQLERKQAPEMYQLKEQRKRQLLQLKRRAPHRYDQVVRTMREIEYLRKHDMNAYLLVTEPPHSPRLKKVR